MKYLQDYMSARQTDALNRAGAFFAFSKYQFDEAKKPGIIYVNGPAGMICPKDTIETLTTELNEIYHSSIKQDLEENGKHNVILRELNNHECFYTNDIDDCVDKLSDYPGITRDDVRAVFKNKTNPTYETVTTTV